MSGEDRRMEIRISIYDGKRETGLCREIKICFVAREHTWYIIS